MAGKHAHFLNALKAALNAHDVDHVTRLHAADFEGLDLTQSTSIAGREQVQALLGDWLKAFPDLRFSCSTVLSLHDRIGVYWTATGHHLGAFLHIPPTRREVTICGFSLLKLQDNEILRGLHLWDMASLLRGMQLLPELPGIPASQSQSTLLTAFLSTA